MPLYVYKCTNCDRTFEAQQTVAEGEKMLEEGFCLKCGAILDRPFSLNVPAIHMRGYSPAHSRFFRGMRPRKKGKKKDE
jgi:putative FmdB family regulatory protein